VPMAKQFFHLHNVHTGVKQKCSGCGSERVRRVDALGVSLF
jgi:hypothetical protein